MPRTMVSERSMLPIPGKLQQKSRILLSDRQITAAGPTGEAGVFAALYMRHSGQHPTIDVRYFGWHPIRRKNVSTIRGVILDSLEDALVLAKSLVELVEIARSHYGLKDDAELSVDPVLREG